MPVLDFFPALSRSDLLSVPVQRGLASLDPALAEEVRVTPIDASLADDLPPEHALPAHIRADAAVNVLLDLFEVENAGQVFEVGEGALMTRHFGGLRRFLRLE